MAVYGADMSLCKNPARERVNFESKLTILQEWREKRLKWKAVAAAHQLSTYTAPRFCLMEGLNGDKKHPIFHTES